MKVPERTMLDESAGHDIARHDMADESADDAREGQTRLHIFWQVIIG